MQIKQLSRSLPVPVTPSCEGENQEETMTKHSKSLVGKLSGEQL